MPRQRPRFHTELDADVELDLIRRAQAGEQQAYGSLLAASAAYMRQQAKRYRSCGLDLEDLEQEARLGFCDAIQRFDLTSGVRLITYARYWVRNRLLGAVHEQARMIRLPREVHKGIARSYRAGEEQDAETLVAGGYLSDEEIAKAAAAVWYHRPKSLDVTAPDGREPMIDRLRAEVPSPEEQVAEAELGARGMDLVEELVETLPAFERDVIRRRYLTDSPATMQEIADGRGCQRQWIMQVEQKAIRRLRTRVANRMGDVRP